MTISIFGFLFSRVNLAITNNFCECVGGYLCVKRHSLYIQYSFGRLPVIISPSQAEAWPLLVYSKKIVYGCNSNRARSGAKNASRLGDWIFSIISGDSEQKCTHVVGLVRSLSLTLLTASPRKRTSPRLLVMANGTPGLYFSFTIVFPLSQPPVSDLWRQTGNKPQLSRR